MYLNREEYIKRKELEDLYEYGFFYREILEMYGDNIIDATYMDIMRKSVVNDYKNENISILELAKRYDKTETGIRYIIQKSGIDIRPERREKAKNSFTIKEIFSASIASIAIIISIAMLVGFFSVLVSHFG